MIRNRSVFSDDFTVTKCISDGLFILNYDPSNIVPDYHARMTNLILKNPLNF